MDTYEKKLALAKEALDSGSYDKETIEYIFPELAESEDEMIRKRIIALFKGQIPSTSKEDDKKFVAWLEKQGKDGKVWFYRDDYVRDKKQAYQDGIDNVLNNPQKYGLEKQAKQEPFDYEKAHIQHNDFVPKSAMEAIKGETIDNANKVEPKFKADDWIIYDRHISKVKDMDSEGYLVEDTYGDEGVLPKEFAEKHYRLWTIQDAKDGDVLIDKSHIGECVFIFKEARPSDIKTDVKNPLAIIGYCGINHIGFTSQLSGLGFGDTANCTYYPATKEQSDLLFQKMKEARYVWDADKKELKKIEQKPAWSEEDEKIALSIEQVMNCASLLNIIPEKVDKIRAWFKSLKDRVGCKVNCTPTKEWNEEDEIKIKSIIAFLKSPSLCAMDGNKGIIDANIKYLKSFKYRVQPKQEWSEEDEQNIRALLSICDFYSTKTSFYPKENKDIENLKNWLKSLRPQSTWKPSGEQMKVLLGEVEA